MLNTPSQAAQWLKQQVSGTLRSDSRAVQAGDAFIAWPGAAVDGRSFVASALQSGASACLVEAEGVDGFAFASERVQRFAGLKVATGPIAAEYFGHPSNALAVLAVTGTNGKTSTAWWLAQALSEGRPVLGWLLLAVAKGPPSVVGAGAPTPRASSGDALTVMWSA